MPKKKIHNFLFHEGMEETQDCIIFWYKKLLMGYESFDLVKQKVVFK